jgi:Flp pilus assembly protein TadB
MLLLLILFSYWNQKSYYLVTEVLIKAKHQRRWLPAKTNIIKFPNKIFWVIYSLFSKVLDKINYYYFGRLESDHLSFLLCLCLLVLLCLCLLVLLCLSPLVHLCLCLSFLLFLCLLVRRNFVRLSSSLSLCWRKFHLIKW